MTDATNPTMGGETVSYTKGPWLVRPCLLTKNLDICLTAESGKVAVLATAWGNEANARLIAAAPELLEAAQSVIARMLDTMSNGKGVEATDGEKCWIVHSDEIDSLRDAITKATGG
jgi:hypothetical protein